MKTIKDFILNDLSSYGTQEDKTAYLNDVITHGCITGCVSSLIYYQDTTKFYETYNEEIWDLLAQISDELGHTTLLETIAYFHGAKDVSNDAQFKNLLSWFAYETVAQQLLNESEDF
jgi:hypothetical protein